MEALGVSRQYSKGVETGRMLGDQGPSPQSLDFPQREIPRNVQFLLGWMKMSPVEEVFSLAFPVPPN
jgi:hypothetical protein